MKSKTINHARGKPVADVAALALDVLSQPDEARTVAWSVAKSAEPTEVTGRAEDA